MNKEDSERLDKLEEEVTEIKEQIKPKQARVYGDPCVEMY